MHTSDGKYSNLTAYHNEIYIFYSSSLKKITDTQSEYFS